MRVVFLVVLIAASISGCALMEPRMPTPAPDVVLIRVHTTGGERNPESVYWRFRSADSPDQSGVVTWIPEGTCIAVGPQWQLQVTTEEDGADPILNAVATSEHFSGESPLDLAIERTEEGAVIVTEGQPDWWKGRPIGCASN